MTQDAAYGDDSDPEPEPPTWRDIRQTWDDLAVQFAGLIADTKAGGADEALLRRWAMLNVAVREARHAQAGQSFADRFAAEAAPAPPRAGRHRAAARAAGNVVQFPPRPGKPGPGRPAGAAAFLGLALGHGAARGAAHGVRVKLGLLGATAAVAGMTAAGVSYTITRTPDQAPVTLPARQYAAPASAAPAFTPAPGPATPAAMGKHHRRVRPSAPPPALPPPAASPSPSVPPSPAPGVLDVQAATVTLTQTTPGQYAGTLTLYATGGPVRWRVDTLGTSSALRFSESFGLLEPGQPVTVTVTADAAAVQAAPGQPWTITLDPGSQQVTVSAAG